MTRVHGLSGRIYIVIVILALCGGMALLAQRTGPITGGPRQVPGPTAPPADTREELPQIETRPRQDIPGETAVFTTETNLVTVDIAVVDNQGNFIPKIPGGNFQILEDGVPQQIVKFGQSEAPMTVCLLIEFSNLFQSYWTETWYQTLTATYGFVDTLRPEDWVAVVAYDLRPEILSDFTKDRRETQDALARLRIAGYSESNLFDALAEMCTRMKDIEGRKSIVVIASGMDTFSKLTYGKTREIVQEAGVTVYAVGLMQALREWYDARGYMGSIERMDFLQADNQLRTFAKETGGISFFPRFYGEFPSIYQAIHYSMRNQYSAVYTPTNQKKDGTWRKIKVRLVEPKTNKDLRIVNEKGKAVKYQVMAKAGYQAPREVE